MPKDPRYPYDPLLTKDHGINTETSLKRGTRNQNEHDYEKYCLNCRDFRHDVFYCRQPGKRREQSVSKASGMSCLSITNKHKLMSKVQRLEAVGIGL